MTHEELLKLIDYETGVDKMRLPYSRSVLKDALRAVVELHKPALTDYPSYCLHCETYGSIVPCPTIQVIERKLG